MALHDTTALETERLVLTPLEIADAAEMVDVLADRELYEFTGGEPPTLEQLERRYRAEVAGSDDPNESWHNWIIRTQDTKCAVGYVQATVTGSAADIAWVIGVPWQRQGFAREAAVAMCGWFRDQGIGPITAHIAMHHHASGAVATACGLVETNEVDEDGEVIWLGA